MVHFVGAGSGAVDLITVRGAELMKNADVVIYAGSLVNPALLGLCRPDCRIYDSAEMTLEQVRDAIEEAHGKGQDVVRLHTGDTSLFSTIREQIKELEQLGIEYDVTPGVSAFCGAAAAVESEYTLPGISQSVIITRMPGRTPVPANESIAAFASHGCSMVVFLSTGLLEELQVELLKGAYTEDTPAAIVYKATWPEQKVCYCKLGELAATAKKNNITKTALMLIGDFLGESFERSLLYDPKFTTEFRQATE